MKVEAHTYPPAERVWWEEDDGRVSVVSGPGVRHRYPNAHPGAPEGWDAALERARERGRSQRATNLREED